MSFLHPASPLKTPADVYDGEGEGLVVYKTTTPVDLMSTGVKNIMQLPADAGDFVWTAFIIRPVNIAGTGTQAQITAGWGGAPTQIISAGLAVSPTATGTYRRVEPAAGFVAAIADNEQIQIEVTTATTGYTTYDCTFELKGYHI